MYSVYSVSVSVIFDWAKWLVVHAHWWAFPILSQGLQFSKILHCWLVRVFTEPFLLIELRFVDICKRKIIPTSFPFSFHLHFFTFYLHALLNWSLCMIWPVLGLRKYFFGWNWVGEMLLLRLWNIFCFEVKLELLGAVWDVGLMIFSSFEEFQVSLGHWHSSLLDGQFTKYYNLKQQKPKLEVSSPE